MVEAFDIQVKSDRIRLKLDELPEELRGRLKSTAQVLAEKLRSVAQALAGGALLQVHTGKFVASIRTGVRASKTSVTGRIHSKAPQAAILEFGGTIPAHEILPNAAQALAFAFQGHQMFAAKVNMPAVHIEKRGILHTALEMERTTIITELKGTVAEAAAGVTEG